MRSKILKAILIHGICSMLWIGITVLIVIVTKIANVNAVLAIGSISALIYVTIMGFILFRMISLHYQRLVDSEQQYRSYFEDNPAPMWVYNRETLKFIAVNNAAIANYGYTRDEFYRMTILDIRAPEESEKVLTAVNTFGSDYKNSGTWNHKKKDGSDIYAHITSHLIHGKAEDRVMIMATDITRRLEIEIKLQEMNEELTKQNNILREISWSESHNVRRPLSSILGLLDILKFSKSQAEKDTCLNYIEVSALELDAMIHDVNKQINDAVMPGQTKKPGTTGLS